MTERVHAAKESSEGPTAEDVRVQLEGRAEVLEAALRRAATLEAVLRGRGWKRRWRAHPTLVSEWLAEEATVEEALERTSRRARVEGWSDTLPVMEGLRELEARRERLKTLVRARLSRLVHVSGPPVLKVELARLDGLVGKRATMTLEPGEVLLFQADRLSPVSSGQTLPLLVSMALLYWGLYVLLLALLRGNGSRAGVALVAFIVAPLFVAWARAGRVWMTSRRLLWMPTFGETVSVPLATIAPGGVHLGPTHDLKVEGEPRLQVAHLADAKALATLLELHSQPPLLGRVRSGVRLADVVVFPASLREAAAAPRSGWAVLRPGGVSFIPEGAGRQVLSTVTGRESTLAADVGRVLEQLRWLSGTEFDDWLTRLVTATGGVSWSAWDSLKREEAPLWKPFRVSRGRQVLMGQMEWSAQSSAELILRSWPDAVTPGKAKSART
ncbi:hypothetical protein HUA74_34355 [Myxococcus sp. CA051A]|uniref:hypothetical protein n=1 Tax=Myxococcus sp. CA051A TaxID=2741739 RepID=UPI00157B8E3D|nr:hypothetical protein [Myxococcus sp. CA051A]NTX65755.1 hypothetical protein [Myxococcus sp. CA051A]